MATVPYTFANYPGGSSIPLEQLDENFAAINSGFGPTGPIGPTGPAVPINLPLSGVDKNSAYTLSSSDVGKAVSIGVGGSIIIPDVTFSSGNVVVIFNHTLNPATINSSSLQTYISGTPFIKASLTLAAYGTVNLWFYSPSICIAYGSIS